MINGPLPACDLGVLSARSPTNCRSLLLVYVCSLHAGGVRGAGCPIGVPRQGDTAQPLTSFPTSCVWFRRQRADHGRRTVGGRELCDNRGAGPTCGLDFCPIPHDGAG